MLLSDLDFKSNEITKNLVESFQAKGIEGLFNNAEGLFNNAEGLFNNADFIKERLLLPEHEVRELEEEGIFYCKQKDWSQALRVLQWLAFFEPFNPSHFLRSGLVLYQMKKFQQAAHVLSLGVSLDTENPKFYFYLGLCYKSLQEKDKFKEAMRTCCDISQQSSEHKELLDAAKEELYS